MKEKETGIISISLILLREKLRFLSLEKLTLSASENSHTDRLVQIEEEMEAILRAIHKQNNRVG